MDNALPISGNDVPVGSDAAKTAPPLHSRYWPVVAAYGLVVILALVLLNVPGATDYVGADNDDKMRLIEVRDLLAGQDWFDMVQHRLGLAGGTLMHWSRFVDLPIANLISLFSFFLPQLQAEAAALLVWPLSLAVALLAAMGLAGRRIGGPPVMHAALALTAILIVTSVRFTPGAIDHHNVQLALTALIAAMLVDPHRRVSSFAVAGLACAMAMAIGAEMTPYVAVASLVVALLWVWHGAALADAAGAFALALGLAAAAAFFATVPPALYGMVTCDSLSIGIGGIAFAGCGVLALSVQVGSRLPRAGRFALLGVDALLVLAFARVLAPQCLGNPLANLDPMLVSLWLDHVMEAQSVLGLVRDDPGSVGGFYAIGLFGVAVCLFRIWHRDRSELHAVLLALLSVSYAIALIQVRGALFANLVAILPLALLIMDLRAIVHRDREDMGASFSFVVATLLAVPSIWALGGLAATEGFKGIASRAEAMTVEPAHNCSSPEAMAQLAALPAGVVAASSELGVHILRYTPHRALSAPYHRDQGGMLTELHIGLATPRDAEAFLRGAEVSIVAFCPSDAQTRKLGKLKPDGLYAQLAVGKVPAYLQALPSEGDAGLVLYAVLPAVN